MRKIYPTDIFQKFGIKIREYRLSTNESITEVANAIQVDRTYISKLENGHERPSLEVLNNLVRHYSLSNIEASDIFLLAGYRGGVVFVPERKEVKNMDKNNPQNPSGLQVNYGTVPSLYSDSVWVTTNPYGVQLDFAVSVGPTNQQNVAARIGMSKEHAKILAQTILKQLEGPKLKNPVNTLKN